MLEQFEKEKCRRTELAPVVPCVSVLPLSVYSLVVGDIPHLWFRARVYTSDKVGQPPQERSVVHINQPVSSNALGER